MKTALLFSGLPRFHAEIDEQLENLKGSNIEWIVVFWKNYPDEIDLTQYITPSWLNYVKNENDAVAWLQERMPQHHSLGHFSFVDWNDFPDTYIISDYPNQVTSAVPNTFRPYYMIKQAYSAALESADYDLIIRSRTDIGLSVPVWLDRINQRLIEEPMRIMVPSNNRQEDFNDLFAFGKPQAMSVYATAVDYFNESYFQRNVTFHAENLVSHVLRHRGVYWRDDGYIAYVRTKGRYLTPNWIRGVKYYEPDFGTW